MHDTRDILTQFRAQFGPVIVTSDRSCTHRVRKNEVTITCKGCKSCTVGRVIQLSFKALFPAVFLYAATCEVQVFTIILNDGDAH